VAGNPEHRVVGYEAIARWHHPDGSITRPHEFLPRAVREGFIADIDRKAVRSCCDLLQAWSRDPERSVDFLTVNVSTESLSEDYVRFVAETLNANGIEDPSSLYVEVADATTPLPDTDVTESLRGLQDLGVRLVLDNFGTKWSAISWLRDIDFDVVKIDRSLLRAAPGNPREAQYLKALLALITVMGPKIGVEGVDSGAECAAIADLPIDFVQGSMFGRQRDLAEMTAQFAPAEANDPEAC
jgi:EAL domain-containing protein (putative c-di-GMP-specific phosphodiesterase class I)